LTGFNSRPVHGRDSASVEMFRESDAYGRPTVQILEDPTLVPGDASRLSAAERRAAVAGQVRRVAGMVATRLWHRDTAIEAPKNDQDIPPYLQTVQWDETIPGSKELPDAFWQHHTYHDVHPPQAGQQTAVWTMNHTFDAYLDNKANDPADDYQVVTYNLNGEFTPKRSTQLFNYMFVPFQVDGVGKQEFHMERAWWTGYADVSVTPDAATDANLRWQASEPATPNGLTTYTSGEDFSVGFATDPSEGPGFESSYKVSNTTEHTIPDWGVSNQTAGNKLAWQFSARNDCDVRPATYQTSNCFDLGFLHNQMPYQPNELSLGQLQLAASGRWDTTRVLSDPKAGGELTFTVSTPVTLADTYCAAFELGACVLDTSELLNRTTVGAAPWIDTIDAYKVVPVAIKSVAVTPATVDGSTNQKATGTVTLASPALIPVTVVIFSDNRNATVGTPTGGDVSRTTVAIDAGQKQASFEILTNANHLKPGATSTAQITAFYGSATTAQLKVTAQSGG
jgi:hypothetical protein